MATRQVTPQEPGWIEHAPVRIEVTRRIAAPVGTVWGIVADHTSWPTWFAELDRVEVTGEANAVGGSRRVTIRGIKVDEVFTAWEPERRFAFAVVATSLRLVSSMAESVELEPDGAAACTVVYRQGLAPVGLIGWTMTHPRGRLQRSLERAVGRLAERAEAAAGT